MKKTRLFLLITFSITWLCWWTLSIIKLDNSPIFNNILHVVIFCLGGIAPTIAAYVAIRFTDKQTKTFNKSVLQFRTHIGFYIFSIFVVLGIKYIAIWLYDIYNTPIWAELSPQFMALIPLTLIMIPLGGLEELGWRGILLPELSKKINFKTSALIVSAVWAMWHLPLFYINGMSHYQSDFLAFVLQTIGLGLVLAWLFRKTNSIFICVLFHAFHNATSSIGLNLPDNGNYITVSIWLLLGLGLLVFGNRNKELAKKAQ